MRSTTLGFLALTSLGGLFLGCLTAAAGDPPGRVTRAIAISSDQSERFASGLWQRGERLYEQNCASCHGTNLKGRGMAPPLLGVTGHMTDSGIVSHARKVGEKMCCARHILRLTDDEFADIIAYFHAIDGDAAVRRRVDQARSGVACCCSRGG